MEDTQTALIKVTARIWTDTLVKVHSSYKLCSFDERKKYGHPKLLFKIYFFKAFLNKTFFRGIFDLNSINY